MYFDSIQNAMDFGELVYNSLPMIENKGSLFGDQLIIDENDMIIGRIPKLLSQASSFTIHALKEKAKEFNGFIIPAHINRPAYSILETLGFYSGRPAGKDPGSAPQYSAAGGAFETLSIDQFFRCA